MVASEVIKKKVEETYQGEVLAVIPFSPEMMELASNGIFAAHFPNHPITESYRQVVGKLKIPGIGPVD